MKKEEKEEVLEVMVEVEVDIVVVVVVAVFVFVYKNNFERYFCGFVDYISFY